jgi:hypothetical protein
MSKGQGAVLTERQRYWLGQIEVCKASGKSIAEYAAQHGVAAQAMYAAKKLLVKKGVLPGKQRNRFQRAQVVGRVLASEWRVQLPNGITVTFSGAVDVGTLTSVLSAAAALG